MKSVIVAGIIYEPLSVLIDPAYFYHLDVRIANGVRCDLRVPPTTVRQVFYTTRDKGGLHISSLVVEHLASCARELQAELEGGSDKARDIC